MTNHSNLPDFMEREQQSLSTLYNDFVNTSTNASNQSDADDYIYSYEASISSPPIDELLPLVLVYGFTFIVGVIGNFLVIFSILRHRRMLNVTNTFLTSLASADLLLVFFCVPIKVRPYDTIYHPLPPPPCTHTLYVFACLLRVICSNSTKHNFKASF